MTKHSRYILVFLSACIATFAACTKSGDDSGRNPCLEPRKYFVKVQTVTAADTGSAGVGVNLPSPVVGYVDTPTLDKSDMLFYYGDAARGEFTGPLSGIADSTRWFIQPDTNNTTLRDTITFHYSRTPVFLSTACGYSFTYSLQRITATDYAIDSVRIEKTEVNGTSDVTHAKIFY